MQAAVVEEKSRTVLRTETETDGTMGWAWAAAAIAGSTCSLSGSRRYWGRQATMSSKHQRGKNGETAQ